MGHCIGVGLGAEQCVRYYVLALNRFANRH